MKALALIVAATGLMATAAKADYWANPPPYYRSYVAPYFVYAGRPYWGGPFFVDRPGLHPPYETYRLVWQTDCRALRGQRPHGRRRFTRCD